MELIANARFKRAMDRAAAASAYTRRITQLVADLAQTGTPLQHPLLETRAECRQAALLVLTANRGMCGGYNASVLRLAVERHRAMAESLPAVRTEVSGKRGVSALRYRRINVDASFTHFKDEPPYKDVEQLANRYLDEYVVGTLDRVDVVYTKFHSSARQEAVAETLLPLAAVAGTADDLERTDGEHPYEFLPSAASILDEILPICFRINMFKRFLDAAASEHIARMVAMKSATENADEIIRRLSITYNRARQAQITGEIMEVIGGAEALEI